MHGRKSTILTVACHLYIIPQVDTVKHLGVHISRDLRWKSHIHSLLEKVRGRIGMLRRISYRCGSFFLRQMYVAGIRSTLEYASAVWRNLTQTDSLVLERLQLQVAKIICHCNNHNQRSALLSRCGLATLAWRRRRARLLLLHSLLYGEEKHSSLAQGLPPLQRQHSAEIHSLRKPLNFLEIRPTTAREASSWVCCAVAEWNALRNELRSIENRATFKLHLNNLPHKYTLGLV